MWHPSRRCRLNQGLRGVLRCRDLRLSYRARLVAVSVACAAQFVERARSSITRRRVKDRLQIPSERFVLTRAGLGSIPVRCECGLTHVVASVVGDAVGGVQVLKALHIGDRVRRSREEGRRALRIGNNDLKAPAIYQLVD